jgi:hypothetical protein
MTASYRLFLNGEFDCGPILDIRPEQHSITIQHESGKECRVMDSMFSRERVHLSMRDDLGKTVHAWPVVVITEVRFSDPENINVIYLSEG